MSDNTISRVEESLKNAMDEYIDVYRKYEALPEFSELAKSARGSGMFFQYHQSVRDAIVERAKENGKKLRKGIYEKAIESDYEMVSNLLSTISYTKMFLANTDFTYDETKHLREMLGRISVYLPE